MPKGKYKQKNKKREPSYKRRKVSSNFVETDAKHKDEVAYTKALNEVTELQRANEKCAIFIDSNRVLVRNLCDKTLLDQQFLVQLKLNELNRQLDNLSTLHFNMQLETKWRNL